MTDADHTADEFLSWLCWTWATDGQRFYPPEETADECVEAVRENYEKNYEGEKLETELLKATSWEKGQHSRAYTEAVSKFRDAANWGFDPIERAAREQHDLRQRSEDYDEEIDWSWLGDRDEFIESLINIPDEQ